MLRIRAAKSFAVFCLAMGLLGISEALGSDPAPRDAETVQAERSEIKFSARQAEHSATASGDALPRRLHAEAGADVESGGAAGGLCAFGEGSCQGRNINGALASNRTSFSTADDFTVNESGQITGLCWWGMYCTGNCQTSDSTDCQGVQSDGFRVRYYMDNGGVPGALMATYTQLSGDLVVSGPQATGSMVVGQFPEYEYSATHPPLAVEAGECYWVEVSNALTGCTWYWVLGATGNGRSAQDAAPLNGFGADDIIESDLALCLSMELGDPNMCLPAHDDCNDPSDITGTGLVPFDNSTATTDGPGHAACTFSGESQIEKDVWYCWTSPCTDKVFVRTCELTGVDTKLAVYEGCGCPEDDSTLLSCNDDRCLLQSMTMFDAVQGQSYMIRVGTFPASVGGPGSFDISCGPPPNNGCPSSGNCCAATGVPGCEDESCCRAVCACDPFCCDTVNGEWDEGCATFGFEPDCGAALLCGSLCTDCPPGVIRWVNPPNGVVDAGYERNPTTGALLGIDTLVVEGPPDADFSCWSLCETDLDGAPNEIVTVEEDLGVYTIRLARPITGGAVTTISYADQGGQVQTGMFTSHPGNVNADSSASPSDILSVIDCINQIQPALNCPFGSFSADVDRSGAVNPADILAVIDALNGAGQLNAWNNSPIPDAAGICP